ncbi:MAG: DUF2062 domain-containing protein [Negativicutes bacterium]|nr:DUF2062 domain-containing protein [Negativicutes bacterium]
MRQRLWRLVKVQGKRLLTLRGDRRVIARGIAVGIAMNFIPTIGLGLPMVYWVAKWIGGHRVAAVVSTMTIKAFFPVLYILDYIVGEIFLEGHLVYTLDWHVAIRAGASLFLGAAINFLVVFIVCYYYSLWLLRKQQARVSGGSKWGGRL